MKTQVTFYKHGQIQRQITKPNREKAMAIAMQTLAIALEELALAEKSFTVEANFLTRHDWSCTVFSGRTATSEDEAFGVTVEKARG